MKRKYGNHSGSYSAGSVLRNLPYHLASGYDVYKRLRSAYDTSRRIRRVVGVQNGFKQPGGGSKTKTKNKRKSHRPMPLTPDEILKCKLKVVLGRQRIVKGLGRYRYLFNDSLEMTGLPGEQQTDRLQPILNKDIFDTLYGNIESNSSVQLNQDNKWFLASAYQTHQVLNNSNVSCKVVIRFVMAKENIDEADTIHDPVKCWEQSEYAQQNSLSPTFVQNAYAHGPSGSLFNHFWKVLKVCRFSLGPMSTKEVTLGVLYNKFVNELMTRSLTGDTATIRRMTIIPMITVHASPTLVNETEGTNVTLAKAGLCITSSTSYVYKSLENRGKFFTFSDVLSRTEGNEQPNPDRGAAIVESILP